MTTHLIGKRISIVFSLLLCLIVFVSAPVTEAEQGQLVVIAATNAGKVVPGSMLQPGDIVNIPAGGWITLITETGGMIQLGGPYSGPVQRKVVRGPKQDPKGLTGTLTKIAGLIAGAKTQSTVLGASRQAEALAAAQPDPWLMAVDSSGERCVRRQGVQMWRKSGARPAVVSLRSQKAKAAGLKWPAGVQRLQLPPKFIEDGTLIVMKIGQEPRRINLHVTPQGLDLERPGAVLGWMIDRKCSRQAQVYIRRLHARAN